MGQANTPACPIFMLTRFYPRFLAPFVAALLSAASPAQSPQKNAPADATAAVQHGVILAEQGQCREALPILKRSAPRATDKQVKLRGGLAIVRCAMSLEQVETAVDTLLWLNRDFPHDPDVLYVTTHAYSDLSTRASVDLATSAPQSYQAHQLNGEALEIQGKWDEATAEYTKILEANPQLPGIHYRLGRIILSKPATSTTVEEAKKEFQEELKINPNNAGAEYVLGELARQAQLWDEAIPHFSRAAKLDPNFADAFLGLGFCLSSVGRYAEAIPPLETAVKLQPSNPTGHFQLTMAYSRVGRKQDAEREMARYRETSEKALKEMHGENQATQAPAPPQ
jgi:tetratricopeptide (TPR) repeat protein